MLALAAVWAFTHSSASDPRAAAVTRALTLAGALAARGHGVDLLVCRPHGALEDQVPRDVEVVALEQRSAWAARGLALKSDPGHLGAILGVVVLSPRSSPTLGYLGPLAAALGARRPYALYAATTHMNVEAILALDVDVVVPVPDMSALGQVTDDLTGTAAAEVHRSSIWPHVEERVVDLIRAHRSTIVFANSRRLAERLTARLNEIHSERLGVSDLRESAELLGSPAQAIAQSGASLGAASVLAKAHHGSVSREQRALVEDELKTGRLPARPQIFRGENEIIART